MAALLAIAVVAGVVALSQRGEARDAALVADAQRLGAEALRTEALRSRRSCSPGRRRARRAPGRGNLLSVLQRHPAAIGVVDHGAGLYARRSPRTQQRRHRR